MEFQKEFRLHIQIWDSSAVTREQGRWERNWDTYWLYSKLCEGRDLLFR